jgi:hypothetical protein
MRAFRPKTPTAPVSTTANLAEFVPSDTVRPLVDRVLEDNTAPHPAWLESYDHTAFGRAGLERASSTQHYWPLIIPVDTKVNFLNQTPGEFAAKIQKPAIPVGGT